jgi:hypothetical protein
MPWYFRTLASWVSALHDAGLSIEHWQEPVDSATGRPLSPLIQAVAIRAAV